MAPSELAIQHFIANNANVCPCSEAKSTRNGCCCKWVILQSRGRNCDEICVGHGRLHALPTVCIDSGSLQELILSKSAIPLTGDLEDVHDCMSIWGRGISEHWHQLVLALMCGQEKRTRKQSCRLCVQIRVNDLIRDKLLHRPLLAHHVLLQ